MDAHLPDARTEPGDGRRDILHHFVEESARCGTLASGRGGGLGGGHDVMRGMRDGGREQGAQSAGER